MSSTLTKNNSADSPISLTVCQFLLHQCCLNGFVWDVLVREPLVARRHQRHCVSVTVALRRVAPRLGAVAAGVAVVASVRVSSRPPGRVLIKEVRVGGGTGRPRGRRNLDGAWPFHSLERDAERRLERFGNVRGSGVTGHGRDFGQTHNVGCFATCLENVDGVVRVNVLHGNPIDHDNLVFGAAHEGNTTVRSFVFVGHKPQHTHQTLDDITVTAA